MQSGQERPLNDIMMSTDVIQGQNDLLSEADVETLFPKENSKNDGEKTEEGDSASVKGNTLQGDAETIVESSVATASLLSTPFQPKSATDPLNIGVAEEEVPVTEHDGCNSNAVPSATDYYESPADIANERRNLKDMASVDLLAFGNEERLTELLPDN